MGKECNCKGCFCKKEAEDTTKHNEAVVELRIRRLENEAQGE